MQTKNIDLYLKTLTRNKNLRKPSQPRKSNEAHLYLLFRDAKQTIRN